MLPDALSHKAKSLSIIIPTLNEEFLIEACLRKISPGSNLEVILVDGGSQDQTLQMANGFDDVRIIQGHKGRAQQMNKGASSAKGDYLLFLHADCLLPDNFEQEIREKLSNPDTVCGAFTFKTDYSNPLMWLIEILVNVRSHIFSLPYGDQGIFMKAEIFQALGGYPAIAVMEDFKLMRKVKKYGKIRISKLSILVSGRKWRQQGILKTTLIHQFIIISTLLGISPLKLSGLFKPKKP